MEDSSIEYENGNKKWYMNGLLHREDGPAIERVNGRKLWCKNGLLHRENGPAIEYENGDKRWYLRGLEIKYNKETWDQKVNESDVEHIMNK